MALIRKIFTYSGFNSTGVEREGSHILVTNSTFQFYVSHEQTFDQCPRHKHYTECKEYECKEVRVKGNTRRFAGFRDYLEFLEYYHLWQSQNASNKDWQTFYEMILGNMRQKPYFDLDYTNITLDEAETRVALVRGAVSKVIPGVILTFESHGMDKFSYHLICRDVYVESAEHNRCLANQVARQLPDKYIDTTVYSSLQNFRLFDSTKRGKKRFKTLCSQDTKLHYSDATVASVNATQPIDKMRWRMIFKDSLITLTAEAKLFLVTGVSSRRRITIVKPHDFNDTELKFIEAMIPPNYTLRSWSGLLANLAYVDRKIPCEVCGRSHDHENPYIQIRGCRVLLYCRRAIADGKEPTYVRLGMIENTPISRLSLPVEEHHMKPPDIKGQVLAALTAPHTGFGDAPVSPISVVGGEMKICEAGTKESKVPGCKKSKPLTFFYKGRAVCKECYNASRSATVTKLEECKPQEISLPAVLATAPDVVDEIKEHVETIVDAASTSKTPVVIMSELLPMLKSRRVVEPYWSDIGRALSHVSHNAPEGLELWTQFGEPFGIIPSSSLYESFRSGNVITERTIGYYAMLDNKDMYDKWHTKWLDDAINIAINTGHADSIGEVIRRFFWLDLMHDGRQWWYFHTHKLNVDTPKAHHVHLMMISQAIPAISKRLSVILATIADREFAKKKGSLFKSLHDSIGRDKVLRGIEPFFFVEGFSAKCDANANLTGWANCVIECDEKKAMSRWGKPEDYITMSSSTWYRESYTLEHPDVVEVMDFISKIHVDAGTRRYFLKDCSSFLLGRNGEKIFRVWSGDTNAGKSIVIKLLQETFSRGKYIIDFPSTLLCEEKKSSSGPTPEMAQAKGARIGIISEGGALMLSDLIKRHTGGDSYFARNPYEKGGSVEAFYKLVYICNRIAEMKNEDAATRARFRVTPFRSTFVDDLSTVDEKKKVKGRHFLKNPFFEQNIPKMASPFLWLLVTHFSIYKEEGLVPPKQVTDATSKYWKKTDDYVEFIKDNIVNALDEKKEVILSMAITAADIYPRFKWWWKERSSDKIPDVKTFRAEMQRAGRLGPQKQYKWYGKRLTDTIAQPGPAPLLS